MTTLATVTFPSCAADTEGLYSWIRLTQTSGVGNETARKLLNVFGLPENIFSASHSELSAVVPDRIVRNLLSRPADATTSLIEKTLTWIAQPGNHVLTLADERYPKSLLNISDPPVMLYVIGRLELLLAPALAVVGSRNATAQGVSTAEKFSEALSQAGLTIVSGLALGIDTAAHQGGLRGQHAQGGSTIAVIGTGADIVYPARNRALAHQIAEDGCIISEYPLGTPAIASNFPRRNRIISGLAVGVLVIEAAAQSGSLITARMAAEQGRDVFAIPGSIHSPLSKGCHQLIKQGAKLVDSAQDILEELHPGLPRSSFATTSRQVIEPVPSTGEGLALAETILAHMGFDPVEMDILAERCGLDAASTSTHLLMLELDGLIEMLPGGTCQRLV